MTVVTWEHSPLLYTDGRTISNVRRVPVGRKLISIDVFDSVFCTPLAIIRLFLPPLVGGPAPADGAT